MQGGLTLCGEFLLSQQCLSISESNRHSLEEGSSCRTIHFHRAPCVTSYCPHLVRAGATVLWDLAATFTAKACRARTKSHSLAFSDHSERFQKAILDTQRSASVNEMRFISWPIYRWILTDSSQCGWKTLMCYHHFQPEETRRCSTTEDILNDPKSIGCIFQPGKPNFSIGLHRNFMTLSLPLMLLSISLRWPKLFSNGSCSSSWPEKHN